MFGTLTRNPLTGCNVAVGSFASFFLVCCLPFEPVCAAPPVVEVHACGMAEVSFRSDKDYVDPFNEVELDVVVSEPAGKERRVPAFWSSGEVWRFRYASGTTGVHRYSTRCSDLHNRGLHRVEGEIRIVPYTGDNRLFRHGPVRVAAGG